MDNTAASLGVVDGDGVCTSVYNPRKAVQSVDSSQGAGSEPREVPKDRGPIRLRLLL